MLLTLQLQNYALIDSLELEFRPGLNVLTGETGSGKSIIIGGLMLLFGDRASTQLIRNDAKKAIVEGVFDTSGSETISPLLEEWGIEPLENDLLLLRREIHSNGISRGFINDIPVKISLLKEIGKHLVDFHGQHEQQSLMSTAVQQRLLDNVGGLQSLIAEYQKERDVLKDLIHQYQSLKENEQQLRQQREYNQFVLKEIEKVNPQPGELDQIEKELRILENSEYLYETIHQMIQEISESDNPLHDRLDTIHSELERLIQIDKAFENYYKEITSVLVTLEELSRFLNFYLENIDFDQTKIEQLRIRYAELQRLIRKYGSIQDIFTLRDKIKRELDIANNIDVTLSELQKKISLQQDRLGQIGTTVFKERQKVAKKIEKQVEQLLRHLGIKHAAFHIHFWMTPAQSNQMLSARIESKSYQCYERGIDQLEFYITTNIGEKTKPLREVASGGEISRIMLALKTILAQTERLPLLVFDEIDVGISGRIAQQVGKVMKNLAKSHQIIAITHLPQIAAFADHHITVSKVVRDGRTQIVAKPLLQEEEKLQSIAYLMGGEKITQALLQSAKELLDMAK